MAKDLHEQWTDALWNATRPLIVLPAHEDTDILAAACALGHALQDAGKEVWILSPRPITSHASFLTGTLQILPELAQAVTYTCILPDHLTVKNITHALQKTGGGKITLELNAPVSTEETLSFTPALPQFDRIIILGANDMSEIAPLFSGFHQLLLTTPLATLSWHPSAEAFGRWNYTSEHATTACETMTHVLRETSPHSIANRIATCLLAGIIAKTKHFRSELTTPQLLNLAADLVASGADRTQILASLYRTRSIDMLKLWGTACSRLQEVTSGILFSEITPDDFVRTHTSPDILPDIAQEILQSNASVQKVIFFYQTPPLTAYIAAKYSNDARAFLGALRSEGTRESAHHVFSETTTVNDVLSLLHKQA